MSEARDASDEAAATRERADGGELAGNVLRFARMLRRAGLPVGTAQVLAATSALAAVDVTRRPEFYWALHAVFVTRREQHDVFDLAFRLFFRDPMGLEEALGLLLPKMSGRAPSQTPGARRVAEAQQAPKPKPKGDEAAPKDEIVALSPSEVEVFKSRDFEQMSAAELARAKALIAKIALAREPIPTRRFRVAARGTRLALRATLAASLRAGGQALVLRWKKRRTRRPTLVVLCDISGSMERYARVLLHFVHALSNDRDRVHAFLFGTQLTPVSRELRVRDVDLALAKVGKKANDWSGGTRIAASLAAFNRHWARRLLAPGAVVLLITDGLERDDPERLAFEMDRLRRSCRRLVWLNPLLRYAGFEPRAAGIRAMLPHVDEHRPCHDLSSLEALARALGEPHGARSDGARAR